MRDPWIGLYTRVQIAHHLLFKDTRITNCSTTAAPMVMVNKDLIIGAANNALQLVKASVVVGI